jgi:hypothetical protein
MRGRGSKDVCAFDDGTIMSMVWSRHPCASINGNWVTKKTRAEGLMVKASFALTQQSTTDQFGSPMKNNFAYVAIVLDRSGSMEKVRQATIDGFNEFINKQKSIAEECRVLLAQFDDIYEIVFDTDLPDVPKLDGKTFVPRNMTALFDAMGQTIERLGAKLREMPEDDRPDRVLMVTITDGEENASQTFSQTDIKRTVEHQTSRYAWDFVFIGANQDAVLTAAKFGIRQQASLSFTSSPKSVEEMASAVARYALGAREMTHTDRAAGERNLFSDSDREKAQ